MASVPSNDNLLWLAGFVMLVMGIISFCSVCSHFLHWSSDLSALRNDEELTGVVVPFENMCSRLGAMIAYWMVDCSFGIFGIIIPVVIIVIGWRIFRKKALHLGHFVLSAALLLVMGALTMGFIGSKFELAYDIGGRLGHACALDLSQIIGGFGMTITIIAGWVLTGVFINRNFIHIVNGFSDTMVQQSERLATAVKDTVVKSRKSESDEVEDEEYDEQQDEVVQPTPIEAHTIVTHPHLSCLALHHCLATPKIHPHQTQARQEQFQPQVSPYEQAQRSPHRIHPLPRLQRLLGERPSALRGQAALAERVVQTMIAELAAQAEKGFHLAEYQYLAPQV